MSLNVWIVPGRGIPATVEILVLIAGLVSYQEIPGEGLFETQVQGCPTVFISLVEIILTVLRHKRRSNAPIVGNRRDTKAVDAHGLRIVGHIALTAENFDLGAQALTVENSGFRKALGITIKVGLIIAQQEMSAAFRRIGRAFVVISGPHTGQHELPGAYIVIGGQDIALDFLISRFDGAKITRIQSQVGRPILGRLDIVNSGASTDQEDNIRIEEVNIEVIAEGVETEAEFQILYPMNVDMIQGYYFGKPMDKFLTGF